MSPAAEEEGPRRGRSGVTINHFATNELISPLSRSTLRPLAKIPMFLIKFMASES
jgi:hypothetical protein